MELSRLRYFVTVAEEGNVGRAAQRLHMSQPPLSRHIRQLEDELGCELFVRSTKGMRLTAAGAVLLDEARTLLAGADRAKRRVRDIAAGTRKLRVGVLGPGEAALSTAVAAEFGRAHPDAEVSLDQGGLADPTLGLAEGRVDVAITWAPFDTSALVTRTIRTDPRFVAVASDEPLTSRGTLMPHDLQGRACVRFPAEADPAWRSFWEADGGGQEGPVVRTLDECLHAVMWRRAIALVPATTVRNHAVPGISYLPVQGVRPASLVLAWRRGRPSSLVTDYVAIIIANAARLGSRSGALSRPGATAKAAADGSRMSD
jgi:DNA-binding transcriptional LysR family regulator